MQLEYVAGKRGFRVRRGGRIVTLPHGTPIPEVAKLSTFNLQLLVESGKLEEWRVKPKPVPTKPGPISDGGNSKDETAVVIDSGWAKSSAGKKLHWMAGTAFLCTNRGEPVEFIEKPRHGDCCGHCRAILDGRGQ